MSKVPEQLTSPLARVRGLGSAKDGTGHWWWQRVTGLAMVPLCVWFIYSLMSLITGSHDDLVLWFASPLRALALSALLLGLFYHAKLGMQVIIEDYVRSHFTKYTLLLLTKFTLFALAAISLLSVLRLHFLGVAITGA